MVAHSTNLYNMGHRPLRVLISSAFWLEDSDSFWTAIGQLLIVSAPAERRLGSRRFALVAAAGHVGATLVTTAGIAVALSRGMLPHGIARTTDVGVSYALYAVAAACIRGAGRRRPLLAAMLTGYLLALVVWRGTFTDVGHLAAAIIGVALCPRGERRSEEGDDAGPADDQGVDGERRQGVGREPTGQEPHRQVGGGA